MATLNPYKLVGRKIRDLIIQEGMSLSAFEAQISAILRPEVLLGQRLNTLRKIFGYKSDDFREMIDRILSENNCGDMTASNAAVISKIMTGKRKLEFLEGLAVSIALGVSPWALAPDGLAARRSARSPQDQWLLIVASEDGLTLTFQHLIHQAQLFTLVHEERIKIPEAPTVTLGQVITLNPVLAEADWNGAFVGNPMKAFN
jgi:hypothetical protein